MGDMISSQHYQQFSYMTSHMMSVAAMYQQLPPVVPTDHYSQHSHQYNTPGPSKNFWGAAMGSQSLMGSPETPPPSSNFFCF